MITIEVEQSRRIVSAVDVVREGPGFVVLMAHLAAKGDAGHHGDDGENAVELTVIPRAFDGLSRIRVSGLPFDADSACVYDVPDRYCVFYLIASEDACDAAIVGARRAWEAGGKEKGGDDGR